MKNKASIIGTIISILLIVWIVFLIILSQRHKSNPSNNIPQGETKNESTILVFSEEYKEKFLNYGTTPRELDEIIKKDKDTEYVVSYANVKTSEKNNIPESACVNEEDLSIIFRECTYDTLETGEIKNQRCEIVFNDRYLTDENFVGIGIYDKSSKDKEQEKKHQEYIQDYNINKEKYDKYLYDAIQNSEYKNEKYTILEYTGESQFENDIYYGFLVQFTSSNKVVSINIKVNNNVSKINEVIDTKEVK